MEHQAKKTPLWRVRKKLIGSVNKAMELPRSLIAKRSGLSPHTVTQVIRGHLNHARSRRKIEAATEVAWWSDQKDFEARLPMIRFFNHQDIDALSLRDLKTLLAKRGLPTKGVGSPELARWILRKHYQEKEGSRFSGSTKKTNSNNRPRSS